MSADRISEGDALSAPLEGGRPRYFHLLTFFVSTVTFTE